MSTNRGRTVAGMIVFLVGIMILVMEHLIPPKQPFTWTDVSMHGLLFGAAGFLCYPNEVLPLLKIVAARITFSKAPEPPPAKPKAKAKPKKKKHP